jgi:prevent-host-death family protein
LGNTTFAAYTAMLYTKGMRYSTSDLSRKSGDIIARALQGPITITQRGKPRLVILSIEEYNRLRGKKNDSDVAHTSEA